MRVFSMTLVLALAIVAVPAMARPDKLVVFGDSLVDAGNAYIGSRGKTAQPGYGYFNGRFTNGPTWVDIVNQRLTGGKLTSPFLLGGDNYAVGGAEAAEDRPLLGLSVPGLITQLGIFAKSGKPFDARALYVLNFGNNDVSALEARLAGATSPAEAAAIRAGFTSAFVGNYVGAVTALQAAGARQFLIGGVPNPADPNGVALETALQLGLAAVPLAPATSLRQFDYFRFFGALQARPTAFGLPTDISFTGACVDISKAPANPRPNCHHFFSFDGIHPTAPVHRAIAAAVDAQLGIVPEPASWALMVTGFGLVGSAVRRRRITAA